MFRYLGMCIIFLFFSFIIIQKEIVKIGNKKASNDIIIKNKKTKAIIEYKRDYTKIYEDTINDLICFYTTNDDLNKTKRVFVKEIGYKKEDIEII